MDKYTMLILMINIYTGSGIWNQVQDSIKFVKLKINIIVIKEFFYVSFLINFYLYEPTQKFKQTLTFKINYIIFNAKYIH